MYIVSLVLGILALVLAWIPIIGFILSIVALIISIIAMVKKKPEGKGMGIAGMILSIIAVIIALIMTLLTAAAAYAINEGADEIVEKAQEAMRAGDIANIKAELTVKYAEIASKNFDNEKTGYIDKRTELYVDRNSGISLEEYLEEYMEDRYPEYDIDVILNSEGVVTSIEVD